MTFPLAFHTPSLPKPSPAFLAHRQSLTCSTPLPRQIPLGPSSLNLSTSVLAAGTIAWGDVSRGYGTTFTRADLQAAYTYLTTHGVTFFDTAEVYGYRSRPTSECAEHLLGSFQTASSGLTPTISTKYFPVPWTNFLTGGSGGLRLGRAAVLEALRASLTRLGIASIPVYVLHFPFAAYPGATRAIADGLADAYNLGLISAVGVSNYNSPDALREICAMFAERDVPVVSNQIRYNLLDRSAESSGLLETALELGLVTFAYEPLAKGLLTGKYTDPERLVSPGRLYTTQQLTFYKQMTNLMKFVGAVQGGATKQRSIAEVAVKYVMSKGIVPICGIKNEGQARELVRSMDPQWSLDDCIDLLDEKSAYMAKQAR